MPDGSGEAGSEDAVVGEILAGLAEPQKSLPPKLFYDDEGCRLFRLITRLDEYYLTRTETALLAASAEAIAARAPQGAVLVEYGASDEAKAGTLLETGRFAGYIPIDIARPPLDALAARLARTRPQLSVRPVAADFLRPVVLPRIEGGGAPFGFFPGSTIGNLDPDSVVRFLAHARQTLAADDAASAGAPIRFAIGTDLHKDPSLLLPAYDDRDGVTAAFNRNILSHVNRIAAAGFEPSRFAHSARWNAELGRIEMHLVSDRAQSVSVAGRPVVFGTGESIHTESSYKHTREGFERLAARAGWHPAGFWTDPEGLFGIHLVEARR